MWRLCRQHFPVSGKKCPSLVVQYEANTRKVARPEEYFLAAREDLEVETIKQYATHEHHLVRARICEHPLTPEDVLIWLSKDSHPEVRIALCERTSLPNHILDRLIDDENPDIRYSLAESPKTPNEYLERLLEDSNPYVCHRARASLSRRLSSPPTLSNGIQNADKKMA